MKGKGGQSRKHNSVAPQVRGSDGVRRQCNLDAHRACYGTKSNSQRRFAPRVSDMPGLSVRYQSERVADFAGIRTYTTPARSSFM